MAWNSLFKKLIRGDSNAGTETAPGDPARNTKARYENLSGTAFKKQLMETPNAVLLDVRTASEFAAGTIPKALNVDIFSPKFSSTIDQLDKDAAYFVFCRSGNRSGQACRIMHQKGYDVRNLADGIGAYPS
jgi:rhodanese-related sulfurtransferase